MKTVLKQKGHPDWLLYREGKKPVPGEDEVRGEFHM